MNTTWSKPDSVSSENITPLAPRSLRTMRCTPADKRDVGMGEALVHAIGDRAVVVQRCEHVLDRVEQVVDAVDVEEGLLLAGERRIGQIFRGGRRAHRERQRRCPAPFASASYARGSPASSCAGNGCVEDPAADFLPGLRQRLHVVDIELVQRFFDALGEPALRQKIAIGRAPSWRIRPARARPLRQAG